MLPESPAVSGGAGLSGVVHSTASTCDVETEASAVAAVAGEEKL